MQLNFNIFSIGSFFNHKDCIDIGLQSHLIYKFSCTQCVSEAYVGYTTRMLRTRVAEHAGISSRTGNPLLNPPQSSIRNHAEGCPVDINVDKFVILGKANHTIDQQILESLHIFRSRPSLNSSDSSFPLNIVK